MSEDSFGPAVPHKRGVMTPRASSSHFKRPPLLSVDFIGECGGESGAGASGSNGSPLLSKSKFKAGVTSQMRNDFRMPSSRSYRRMGSQKDSTTSLLPDSPGERLQQMTIASKFRRASKVLVNAGTSQTSNFLKNSSKSAAVDSSQFTELSK